MSEAVEETHKPILFLFVHSSSSQVTISAVKKFLNPAKTTEKMIETVLYKLTVTYIMRLSAKTSTGVTRPF